MFLDSDTQYNKKFYNLSSTTRNRAWLVNVLQEDSSSSSEDSDMFENYKKLLREHSWKKSVITSEVMLTV